LLTLFSSAGRLRPVEVRDLSLDGFAVRSYMSRTSRFPVVVLHGLTREGYEDARLVAFCRMLAVLGFCVYTPNLQGLCEMDPGPVDIERLSVLFTKLWTERGSPIGVIGFSFGGTYALLASSAPGLSGGIRFILAVGAYYTLNDVVERAFSLRGRHDLSPQSSFALLALDWRYRKSLPLTKEESIAFEDLMNHYCARENRFTSADAALVSKIVGLAAQDEIFRQWKTRLPEISCLDLAGNPAMKSLNAQVFLLHSENDASVPVEESARIETDLARLGKSVVRHVGHLGDHVTFSVRKDAGLARFFYRIMILTMDS
jgi:hypothetical protein